MITLVVEQSHSPAKLSSSRIYVGLIFQIVYSLTVDSSHAIRHSRYLNQPCARDRPSRDPQNKELTPPLAQSRLKSNSFSTTTSPRPQYLNMDRSRPNRPGLSSITEGSSLRTVQLEPSLNGRSPNENMPRDIDCASLPVSNGTVNSPSTNSTTSKPTQYPSPQTRTNEDLHEHYSQGQPSLRYSDASPRNSTNISPPGSPIFSPNYISQRTPQSEDLTPQPIEDHLSTRGTASSPQSLYLDIDRIRPVLPPLSGVAEGSLMVGTFKCEYTGCTAPAFQTQYLLK